MSALHVTSNEMLTQHTLLGFESIRKCYFESSNPIVWMTQQHSTAPKNSMVHIAAHINCNVLYNGTPVLANHGRNYSLSNQLNGIDCGRFAFYSNSVYVYLRFKQQADNTLQRMKLKHGFGRAACSSTQMHTEKREVFGLKVNLRRNGTFLLLLFIFFEAIKTLILISFVPFDVDLTCI